MNTQDNSLPQTPEMPVAPAQETGSPLTNPINWGYWMRRLLVCNPFFLVSAMLLLFGVNRLSLDQGFLGSEKDNLLFNFGALQFYAGLLTVTSIVLSKRRVWYDSALLVVLEHGLVFVPFILIGQAALIGPPLARMLVLLGVLAAAGRAMAIRKWYPQFNLPGRALILGAAILAANIALPFWFRSVVDKQSVWDWMGPNRFAWLVALPILAAGANLLPRPAIYGGLNPQRSWLPLFIYGLWLAASAVHVASVGHLANDVELTLSSIAPLAGVVAWTLWNRLRDFVPAPALWMEEGVLLFAAVSPVLAVHDQPVLLTMSAANLAAFSWLALCRSDGLRRLARHLAAASGPLVLMGLPENIRNLIPGHPTPSEMLTLTLALYALAYGWRWRHPAVAIVSAIIFISFAGEIHPMLDSVLKWQLAMAVVIGHSLRWNDQSARTRFFRGGLAIGWAATFYMPEMGPRVMASSPEVCGLLVLGEWGASWWMTKRPLTWVPPVASAVVIFEKPILLILERGTVGLWSLAGSLVMFGAGALLAWNRRPDRPVTE